MQKLDIEAKLSIVAVVIAAGVLVCLGHTGQKVVLGSSTSSVVAATSLPLLPSDNNSQLTPDGTRKLLMKTITSKNGAVTYIFTTTDWDGNNVAQIYTTTVPGSQIPTEGMTIPFNTWSPDNKYVFLQKNNGDALVFDATGQDIAPDQQYFDVAGIFNAAGKKDTYYETTGWASETLLIVNTLTPEGTKGSSYWFEVPSKAIIQLSTEF